MHLSAHNNAKRFYETYVEASKYPKIVEVGSQNVNGSLRPIFENAGTYTGLDFAPGNGVDIVLKDAYKFPIADNSVDVVITSSCFEHSEMFWLTYSEVLRILKPNGLFYMNAPSNGGYHAFPYDYWRFFPDSGKALVTWGKHCGYNPALLESFISHPEGGKIWHDFTAVFVKDEEYIKDYPVRILDSFENFYNGRLYGVENLLKKEWLYEG